MPQVDGECNDMSFVEFPHNCKVFDSIVDESLPPSQRVPDEEIILKTECDIQANEKPIDTKDKVIDADYIVYIPKTAIIPRMQKGARIELQYNGTDTRTGVVRQYEPGMMLGNRIWVKEIGS